MDINNINNININEKVKNNQKFDKFKKLDYTKINKSLKMKFFIIKTRLAYT